MADLEALKRAAEAATPGPWNVDGEFLTTLDPVEQKYERRAIADLRYFHMPRDRDNAHFIALANPATILDLISRLEEAEKALEDIRGTLLDIADRIEDEGDRTFFGSTNDGDEIKTIAQNLDARRWADVRRAHAAHKRLKGGTDEG